MAELNLDDLKAARMEEQGDEPKYVVLGGEKFEVPTEPPWDFVWALAQGQTNDAMRELFGDEGFERFMAHRPSSPDIEALLNTHLKEIYSPISGEAQAVSGQRSSDSSESSRPTSSASTD